MSFFVFLVARKLWTFKNFRNLDSYVLPLVSLPKRLRFIQDQDKRGLKTNSLAYFVGQGRESFFAIFISFYCFCSGLITSKNDEQIWKSNKDNKIMNFLKTRRVSHIKLFATVMSIDI